jgi:hypothetical protein
VIPVIKAVLLTVSYDLFFSVATVGDGESPTLTMSGAVTLNLMVALHCLVVLLAPGRAASSNPVFELLALWVTAARLPEGRVDPAIVLKGRQASHRSWLKTRARRAD